jgi:hypothetical protein
VANLRINDDTFVHGIGKLRDRPGAWQWRICAAMAHRFQGFAPNI